MDMQTFLSIYPCLWCFAHASFMGHEADGFNFWCCGVVMSSWGTMDFTWRAMLIVGVSSSLPWGAWWFLHPHSGLCFGLFWWFFSCFLTCFYTLLFLHWIATPHYPWSQDGCGVLHMLDTSFLALKPQVCISSASYRWIFITLRFWVSLCALSSTSLCLHFSVLPCVSPLLRSPLW